MRTDPENPNYGILSKQCPRGTICCPPEERIDSVRSAPWTRNTIELLWTLSHGRLKGAPRMSIDDARQGWKTQDPISATGPAQCRKNIRDTFSHLDHGGEGEDARKIRKAPPSPETPPTSRCEFWCMKTSSIRCTKQNGDSLYVVLDDVPTGRCDRPVGRSLSSIVRSKRSDTKRRQTIEIRRRAKESCQRIADSCTVDSVSFKREIPS